MIRSFSEFVCVDDEALHTIGVDNPRRLLTGE
jgi:hypothetical protein